MKVKDSRLNIIQLIKNWCKKDMKNKEKVITINSVSDYISKAIDMGELQTNKTYYFRGEKKKYPNIVPGIYRQKKLSEEGTKDYYNELFSEIGYLDAPDSASLFNTMAELQHYGAMTRMLDVSSNPLVALFFACEDAFEDNPGDGYVYLLVADKKRMKYSNGHTAALKTGLNFIEQEKINQFIYVMDYFHSKIGKYGAQNQVLRDYLTLEEFKIMLRESLEKNRSDVKKYANEEIEKEHRKNSNTIFRLRDTIKGKNVDEFGEPRTYDLNKEEEEVKKEIVDFLIKLKYGDQHYIQYVLGNTDSGFDLRFYQNYLVNELNDFLTEFFEQLNQTSKTKEKLKYPNLVYKDMIKCQFVQATKTQQRIINQSGLFIMVPFVNSRGKSLEDVQQEIHSIIESQLRPEEENICYKIPSSSKKEILKQLRTLGINEGFIYPDIEHKSKAILKKYIG